MDNLITFSDNFTLIATNKQKIGFNCFKTNYKQKTPALINVQVFPCF